MRALQCGHARASAASHIPRAPRPRARRARTLRRAGRVVRNPSRAGFLQRFAKAQQAAANPAFHGAEAAGRWSAEISTVLGLQKSELDGAALRLGKGIHQRADFFRAARLIHRALHGSGRTTAEGGRSNRPNLRGGAASRVSGAGNRGPDSAPTVNSQGSSGPRAA